MLKYVLKAIRTQSPIILLLQSEEGRILDQKVRPSHIVGNKLFGYNISKGQDGQFNLKSLVGVHHWFED